MASFCRSCRAQVNWYKTTTGKNMPLDPEPHPDGNVYVDIVANVVSVVAKGSRTPLYRSHFATCPDAAAHRRPKGAP